MGLLWVPNATAKISVSKINSIVGSVNESVFKDTQTSGNLFKYDLWTNQYEFKLKTKDLSKGTYQITININDGTEYKVIIGLK